MQLGSFFKFSTKWFEDSLEKEIFLALKLLE